MIPYGYLLDTCVFVRFLAEDDSRHEPVKTVIAQLAGTGVLLALTPQVAREAWAVMTRPKEVNGYGLPPDTVLTAVKLAAQEFAFLADTPSVYDFWLGLVGRHRVSGRQVRDAYHVAAMKAHGI